MIKHIVMWKINKDGTDEERKANLKHFSEYTEYLKTIIPEIKSATCAWNVNEGDVFHICIDSVFEDMDALDRYINHPEHLKSRAFLNSISYDKAVFDYYFEGDPV